MYTHRVILHFVYPQLLSVIWGQGSLADACHSRAQSLYFVCSHTAKTIKYECYDLGHTQIVTYLYAKSKYYYCLCVAMKGDRKRLKAEKADLVNQMQQLYTTLESREEQLRDFIRNYDQHRKVTCITCALSSPLTLYVCLLT